MARFHSQVFSTKSPEVEKWRELVSKCPRNDIFFTPEYALVFEGSEGETRADFGGEAQLFFYGDEQNYIVYPFFKRRISELRFAEFLPPEAKDWLDTVSPYGYSGPLAAIGEPETEETLWQGFWKEFHNHCLKSNIAAEFARLHPFIKNHLPLQRFTDVNMKSRDHVVYVDLEQDEPAIRKGMTKGHKSSVSKARRNGVEIVRSKTKDEADAFYQLYIDTMERNEAHRAYFFSKEFLDDTFRLLGEDVQIFSAWYKDQIIAASLFLFKGNLAHYYLSGSDVDFFDLCPNNLLLYEAILWAKEQGYRILNLGGGLEIDDSLFHFKASFSKTTADFHTFSRVHNESAYKILCRSRDEYDKSTGNEVAKAGYFPEYRR